MITEYTDCVELKRLIVDKKIKASSIRRHLSKQGVLLTSSNSVQIADDVYTILLGGKEIEQITQSIIHEGNYEKSTLLKVKINTLDPDLDILDYYADNFNNLRASNTRGFIVEQPVKTDNELIIGFSYRRKLPGKNKLLQEESRNIRIIIRKTTKTEANIDIRHPSSFDSSKALEIIDKATVSDEDTKALLSHINLECLTLKNRVDFFDRLSAYTFSNWNLKTITGITVKKSKNTDNDDELTVDSELDEEHDSSELTGISQAILNGNGLRSNEFVQSSLSKDYFISSMKYRYISKHDVSEFVVNISSKDDNLRVDIDKSYTDDDGRLIIDPIPKAYQDEIIQNFQNSCNDIFTRLMIEQSTLANTKKSE